MNNGHGVAEMLAAQAANAASQQVGYGEEWMANRERELAKQREELAARVAPPGALGLAPLVDERRLKWQIPNEAFEDQACFDRVFIWQIPPGEPGNEKAGDGVIILSTQGAKRKTNEAPRGIIISAGLGAQDHLISHGMAVGHIIKFVRLAPYHIPVGTVMGKEQYVLVMDVANLVSSEDTRKAIRWGATKVTLHIDAEGKIQHRYRVGEETLEPTKPYIPEDYR